MRKLIPAFLLICFSCGLNDDVNSELKCDFGNSRDDLSWLDDEIAQREANVTDFTKYDYIVQSTYQDRTVFIYANCCPTCNSVYQVFDCRGTDIGFIGATSVPDEVLTAGKIVWKHSSYVCN